MPVVQRINELTGPRRLLLAAGAAAVLATGGAGMAYATTQGGDPSSGGYAVVESAQSAQSTQPAPGTDGTGGTDRDCPKDQPADSAESEQGSL